MRILTSIKWSLLSQGTSMSWITEFLKHFQQVIIVPKFAWPNVFIPYWSKCNCSKQCPPDWYTFVRYIDYEILRSQDCFERTRSQIAPVSSELLKLRMRKTTVINTVQTEKQILISFQIKLNMIVWTISLSSWTKWNSVWL